jgi:primosomal protein N' (replication factor Y)
MPPFSHQALLRADAPELDAAIAWLQSARSIGQALLGESTGLQIFDPVPMTLQRLKGRERAQLLIESASRSELHRFLGTWLARLRSSADRIAWHLEVDPAEI